VVVDGRATDGAAVGPIVACHSLDNRGELVAETEAAADPPDPRGGAVADGVYELTEATRWRGVAGRPGPTGRPARATLSLRAGRYESVSTDPQGVEFRHAGTFEARASSWRMRVACPVSTTSDFEYTATDAGLTLYLTTDGVTVTSVYARR
jgi:hypothetical protein